MRQKVSKTLYGSHDQAVAATMEDTSSQNTLNRLKAEDPMYVEVTSPTVNEPNESIHHCVHWLHQNYIQRILSASVLAPAVTYVIWHSPAFATATICGLVANVCNCEYAWLSYRIHHQLMHRIMKLQHQAQIAQGNAQHEPELSPSEYEHHRQSFPSCSSDTCAMSCAYPAPTDAFTDTIGHNPNLDELTQYHQNEYPQTGTSLNMVFSTNTLTFSAHPQQDDCSIAWLASRYFQERNWLAVLSVSACLSTIMTLLFIYITGFINALHTTELYAYRWIYAIFSNFAACMSACYSPTWQHSFILILQDLVFTFLTMHSVMCPINQISCDFLINPTCLVAFSIVLTFFFRWISSPNCIDALVHFILDIMGFFYIIGSLSVLVAFVDDDKRIHYRKLLIILLCVVWGSDTGAYLTGKILSRLQYHKNHFLAPHISKSKDYEGTLGAIFFGVGSMLLVSGLLEMPGSATVKVLFTILAVIIGRLGDLFESLLKRVAIVKDSGRLIPGHGGMLDRIDALMFASLVFARYYALVISPEIQK